jgi:hypothetical protein
LKALRVVLLLLGVQVLAAQGPAPGSLEGVAVIAGSGDAVPGAILELRPDNSSVEPLYAASQTNGRFFFRNVPPGRYVLFGTKNGYLPAELGQKNPARRGAPIVIASGQQIQGLPLAMTPAAAITGQIMDRFGQPMPGATVQLLRPEFQDGRRMMAVMKSTLTNDLGEYRMFWVTPGSYYVNVIALPDTPTPGGTNIVMNPSGQPANRSLWSNVFNVATRPVGSGLPDTEAYLPIFFPGTADEIAATVVELQPGAEVRSIDIRVTPVRAFRVRGLVLNGATRQPAAGAQVQMFSVSPGSTRFFQVNADAMGMFVIPRVPAGPYALASVAGGAGIGRLLHVELKEADIEATLDLQPLYNISGRVIGPNPGAFQVRLRLDYPIPNPPQINTVPSPDGSFSLRGIPPGDFRVFVAPLLLPESPAPPSIPATLRTSYVKSIRMGSADLLDGNLRLDSPPESQIEIQIATDPGSLNGRVVNSRGEPVTPATVVLVPEGERRVFRADLNRVTASNETGQFLFESIPPGDYRVFAWEDVEDRAWQDPGFVRPYLEMSKAVRVLENSRQTVEVTSIP